MSSAPGATRWLSSAKAQHRLGIGLRLVVAVILISYVYNLAFSGSRGVDYGFASAISIVIFFIVGAITLFQFRYTRMWEEVSENV